MKYTLLYQEFKMVSSSWSEKGIGCGRESFVTDLNSTALGFRTLRLRGYDVSAGIYLYVFFLVFFNLNFEYHCLPNI